MRYRPHRSALADSLAEAVTIDGTREALISYIRHELGPWTPVDHFPEAAIHVSPYYGDDDRIGWKDVHIITLDGYGVIGFCEGNVS